MTRAAVTAAVLAALGLPAASDTSGTSADAVVRGLICIHEHEGSWTANTGNGYYGGLQMDSRFEREYGREFVYVFGHAYNWTPAMQLAVGVRAWTDRGYRPWPNTARMCGLL